MKYIFAIMTFVSVILLGNTTTQALHWNVLFNLCPEEIIQVPPMIVDRLPIPVGCEVVDCCPGCPGPGPLEWRINVDGNRFDGAVLRFEGLGSDNLKQLKFSGNVQLEGESIIIGPGSSSISGLPDTVLGNVPVGFVKPMMNEQDTGMLNKTKQEISDDVDGGDSEDRSSGISINQYLGSFQVNRFRAGFILRPCPPGQTRADILRITSNRDGDSVVAMIDYRETRGPDRCVNDQINRTVNEENMGNILTNGSCNSEVSVFSDNNAMAFDESVTTWTNNIGDVHTVDLQPMLVVPVSVWVANAASLPVAMNDFANANMLYNQNNVGIQFNPTYNNVSGNPTAVTTIGGGCVNAATVQGSTWYTPNTLNIYYVGGGFTGVNCGFDRNISYIGTAANLGSLPHEIGHAYGLRPSASWGHTNRVPGFGNNNIMWGGGPGTRNHFSVGQSFRLNVHDGSMLNVNGDRTGSTRTCAPNFSDQLCPNLALDSLPQ